MLFVETHYTLATEEAERIGVDHVARLSNTGTIDGSTGTCIHDQVVKFRLNSRAERLTLSRTAMSLGDLECQFVFMHSDPCLIILQLNLC